MMEGTCIIPGKMQKLLCKQVLGPWATTSELFVWNQLWSALQFTVHTKCIFSCLLMLSILNMIIFFWNLMSYPQIYEMFLNFLPSTKYYFYCKGFLVFSSLLAASKWYSQMLQQILGHLAICLFNSSLLCLNGKMQWKMGKTDVWNDKRP